MIENRICTQLEMCPESCELSTYCRTIRQSCPLSPSSSPDSISASYLQYCIDITYPLQYSLPWWGK